MAETKEKVKEAGANEVFICVACSRAFSDRAATKPQRVTMRNVIVQTPKVVPHKKYPNDPDLAKVHWISTPTKLVEIKPEPAQECCKTSTVLCNASRIRFRQAKDKIEITGAQHLE